MFQLRSLFFSTLALASIAFTPACGTQAEDSSSLTAREDRRLEGEASTDDTEKKPGSGTFCGGFAAIRCAEGFTCVDDPNDSCDPNVGGADCGGICEAEKVKPPKCDYKDPTLRYVSRDPNECPLILFVC